MNIRYKDLLPLAAILLSGIAGSSIAFAQAQPAPGPSAPAPIPFCGQAETMFTVKNGPTPNPSPSLKGPPQNLNPATNTYNHTGADYHFGDTFTLPPGQITKLILTTVLQANRSDANNDGISFSAAAAGFTASHFGMAINALSPGWGTPGPAKSFTFEFPNSGTQVKATPPGSLVAAGPYNGATFFGTDLNTPNNHLDMYVQDDTRVLSVEIQGCVKPYDLSVSKKREGSAFTIDVTNTGAQISPSGKIEIVEVVPAGLTITGASVPPGWVCSVPLGTVVGPNAFTCTYQVNVVIPSGQHLPQIVLKTTGQSECPNCVRTKLYLKDVGDGQTPVNEGDMKNNVSCAK